MTVALLLLLLLLLSLLWLLVVLRVSSSLFAFCALAAFFFARFLALADKAVAEAPPPAAPEA